MRFKQVLSRYFGSWWLPGAVYLAALMLLTGPALLSSGWFVVRMDVLLLCLVLPLGGIVAAVVWNLIGKRWGRAVVNFAMLSVCGGVTFFLFGFLMWATPSQDHFADDLTIPPGLAVDEPGEELDGKPGGPEDTFQADLLAALRSDGGEDPSVTADVSNLIRLQQRNPEVLRRYLATSPCWRLFRDRRGVFATRRWMVGSEWQYSLHGYYTNHDIDEWRHEGIPGFSFRLTLGLAGRPWAGASSDSTRIRQGRTARLELSTGRGMNASHCVIDAGDLVVEVLERSTGRERRLTGAALAHMNQELEPLVGAPEWRTIQRIVPEGAIRLGAPSLALRRSSQPGTYNSQIWVNPGEPGMVFLKAYEVTRGTRLSARSLRGRSNEWVGWSDDPRQLFLSNTHFWIYEGDWGKPYAARFEVWFAPDSGAGKRKLTENIFKIEGWQR